MSSGFAATLPSWRRTLYVVCGYEQSRPEMTEEQRAEQNAALTSIEEDPKWSVFVNINAVILMTIGMFLWGFFA